MADDYIPHDDPRRVENLSAFLAKNHPDVPHVVYHGSDRDILSFDPEKAKSEGNAFFFSKDWGVKPTEAGARNAGTYAPSRGGSIYPVHLSMKDPHIVGFTEPMPHNDATQDDWDRYIERHQKFDDQFNDDRFKERYFRKAMETAKYNGNDGVIFKGITDDKIHHDIWSFPSDIFAVFNPSQIKSAIGNQGTFDPSEPDINKARGGSANFSSVDHNDPAFRSWFGKSVLHDDGVPRTYYHGTSKDIDFKKFKMSRHGIWMTSEPEEASQYALDNDSQGFKRDGWDFKRVNTASRVIPVHARIEKPFVGPIPDEYRQDNYKKSQSDWFDSLRANGYDGWVPNSQNGKLAVALGHPGQIKSALSNSGEYSETGDINKADGGPVDNQPLRDLNASGLYSHAAEMASQLPQERGSPQQMAGMLTNKYGVKPVEMEGFDEAFAGQPSVTRDQLVQHFTSNMPQIERKVLGQKTNAYPYSTADEWQSAINRAERQGNFDESQRLTLAWEEAEGLGGQGAPKFQKYTLPGGENYREVLLKMPESSPQLDAIYNRMEPFINTPNGTSSPEFQTLKKQYNALTPTFKSSHYPDLNILVHTRLSDRTGPNNEKILHIEEIQSDWAQKGRKEGFVTKYNPEDIKEMDPANITSERRRNEFWNFQTPTGALDIPRNERFPTIEAARQHILDNVKPTGVPSAPYVTNTAAWTDLALKDILNEAVTGGYDKVVWTPGAEQAKRYGLSQHIDNITWSAEPDGKYWVGATAKDGSPVRGLDNEPMTPKQLEDTFGREVAEKIVKGEGKKVVGGPELELSGLDLQTGGEGMKGYYDKIVPTQLSKLLKKLDPEARIGRDAIGSGNYEVVLSNGEVIGEYSQRPMANLSASMTPDATVRHSGLELPSITITPKMREALKRGLPAYADGGSVDDEDEGLTAYHGSPHDFEQFDTSKIGTGEGAQAYGHGLYFAESEPVAQEYRDKLTAGTYKGDTGAVFDPFRNLEHMNVRVAAYKSIDNAIDRAKDLLGDEDQSHNADMINRDLAKLMEVKAQNAQPQTGRMYEVRINAHPDHFLDWDKPLAQQGQKLNDGINSLVRLTQHEKENLPVSLIYEMLGKPSEATARLRDAGIPGIKYLDAGSRSSGEGSRNYVVFNHDHVQVKRKYAQGGAIAGA